MTLTSEVGAGRSQAVRGMGLAAVALALVGVPLEAAYLVGHARTELTAPHVHSIRDLLAPAADAIPPDGSWVITSAARTPNALYFLQRPPVEHVPLAGRPAAVHARLVQAGVDYVIVLYRNRPTAFRTRHDEWYRVVLARRGGVVLLVEP
jgi:hypothetical protein